MRFALQLLAVALAAFVGDVIASLHILALGDRRMAIAVGSVFALHVAQLPQLHWFTQQPGLWARMLLCTAGGVGAGAGSWVVLLLS